MMDAKFLNAEIKQISGQAWKLTINYSYYNLYNYSCVYVYKSLVEAKNRLILERCNKKIIIIDEKNADISIEVDDG